MPTGSCSSEMPNWSMQEDIHAQHRPSWTILQLRLTLWYEVRVANNSSENKPLGIWCSEFEQSSGSPGYPNPHVFIVRFPAADVFLASSPQLGMAYARQVVRALILFVSLTTCLLANYTTSLLLTMFKAKHSFSSLFPSNAFQFVVGYNYLFTSTGKNSWLALLTLTTNVIYLLWLS